MWCWVGLFRSFMGANCSYWDPKVDSSFSKYYFPDHTTRILIWLYWLGWNRIGTHAESSIWHHTCQTSVCGNCDTRGLIPYPAFEGNKGCRLAALWFSPPARQRTKTGSVWWINTRSAWCACDPNLSSFHWIDFLKQNSILPFQSWICMPDCNISKPGLEPWARAVEINGVRSYTSRLAGAVRAPCNRVRTLGTISSYLYTLSCTATYNN